MHHHIPGAPGSLQIAKAQAKRLRAALNTSCLMREALVHGQALELVAKTHGFESWGHLVAAIRSETPGPAAPPPPNLPPADLVGGTPPDLPPFPDAVFSLGYLLRQSLIVNRVGPGSMQAKTLVRLATRAVRDPIFQESEENRRVREFLGIEVPDEATLIRTDQIPDLIRLVHEQNQEVQNQSGLIPTVLKDALNALRPHLRGCLGPEYGLSGRALHDRGLVPIGPALRAHDPVRREDLRDRRHTLLIAPTWVRSRVMARLIDQDVLDLTEPGRDVERLLLGLGIDGLRISAPMDALLWASGLLIGVSLHQGGLSRSERPITVLVRGSDLGASGEVLLAQARSLGLHICVWADKALEGTGRLEGVMANTHRVLEDMCDGTAQLLMRQV